MMDDIPPPFLLAPTRKGGAPALDQYLRSKWCRRSGNTHILAPSLSCTPAASSISPSWLHPGSCIVSIFCQTGAPMLLRMLKQEHMQCCNCTLPSQRPQRAVSIPSMRHQHHNSTITILTQTRLRYPYIEHCEQHRPCSSMMMDPTHKTHAYQSSCGLGSHVV